MLYVITAVHNRYEITEKFIDCLKRQTYKDIRLLLVDDGSTDGTAEMVKSKMPNAIVLTGDGNLWWGGALHMAYKYLKKNAFQDCKYVMFLNDDTVLLDDFIEKGLEHLCKNTNSLVTGCGYSIHSKKIIDGAVNYNLKTGEVTILDADSVGNCASTRALMMTFSTLLRIGGFHPKLLPHYGSDYEFTIRASKKGIKTISCSAFRYDFDEGTTGFNTLKGISAKKLMSKRSRFNPIYRIIFMFMVIPIWYVPNNIIHGLKRARMELRKQDGSEEKDKC